MENDILDMLDDLGYKEELCQEYNFEKAMALGPKNIDYTKLIEWICNELRVLCKLEERVNSITSDDDTSNFLLELSSFLKELGCAYTTLVEGHLSDRLNTREKRLLLVNYLLSELMAARMVRANKPYLNKGLELKLEESSTAADLKSMLMTLKFNKPPGNVTAATLFSKVEEKLKEIVKMTSPELLGKPMFNGKLSDKQWHMLGSVHAELQNEYQVRREMLIKRLDVTIQSFQWSEKAKTNENNIVSNYNSYRSKMMVEPDVSMADLLAAREDLAIIEKTSNASIRKNTQSSINKIIIGRVPDRGGRPGEQEAPPPEMPSWQKDRALGGGSGRGGFHGSGRVQGNWSQSHNRSDRGGQGHQGHQQGYHHEQRGGGRRVRGGRYSGGGKRDYSALLNVPRLENESMNGKLTLVSENGDHLVYKKKGTCD